MIFLKLTNNLKWLVDHLIDPDSCYTDHPIDYQKLNLDFSCYHHYLLPRIASFRSHHYYLPCYLKS